MSDQRFEDRLQAFIEEMKHEDKMTEKQRSILEAAIKLFAGKGFHATSTSEIAKEAGVAEGTIFRHYKTKKDILIAAVAPVIVKIAAPFILSDIREILKTQVQKSFADVASELFKNRLSLLQTNEKHFRILIQEVFFHEELREALIDAVAREALGIVKEFVEQKIDAGELRPLPPEVIVRVIFSLLVGTVVFKYAIGREEYALLPEEEQVALTVDILMNGISRR
ncbi:TetR/AcrR family transcriptional regulator [Brevibacillus humidisoli]|uniref:TetR/AcrR family transcriptional regulator n=1 Tax=Brevibacillus humidisoli TaxID=2895522 RepID=UPI001E3698F2|nr:TetR/AcrR family transcriptional regulator [Brevibacillus humidisoli]UFJ39842.1 TetR/AcrR family transcriptional regulator [Brevibacillus humidisoli]